ncbi:MAG TPA: CHAD domain-containing protein [Pyrinomonadaceae bacterium]
MAKAHQIEGIDCQGPAGAGIQLVLLERFDELLEYRREALNFDNSEGVHSMRVASRRLRSALRDFSPYIKKRGLAPTLKKIKTVADALGEVRDQDVALEALQELAPKTSPSVAKVIEHTIEQRKEERDKARKDLKEIVSKNELDQLKVEFRAVVVSTTNAGPGERSANQSYIKVAGDIIQDRLTDFEKLSDSLFKPFDVKELHELRIASKRLRYAIELFDQCWAHSTLAIAKRISRLQTSLGNIHDCDVWIESFGKTLIDSKKQPEPAEMEAIAWLLSHFMKIRIGYFREAFAQWTDWEAEEISEKLRHAVKN